MGSFLPEKEISLREIIFGDIVAVRLALYVRLRAIDRQSVTAPDAHRALT